MMFINGAKEWIGKRAHTFLFVRTELEQQLLAFGYEYFYGGIISKRSIYESHAQMLGSSFNQILIDFSVQDDQYIFAPEYTFRVYDYLNRNHSLNKGKKIFYSQEMLRNETIADIEKGKTFAFWQTGYELFGDDDTLLSVECMSTLFHCLQILPLDSLYFRITDKRILNALCKQYSIEDRKNVLSILEDCNEDGDLFYSHYTYTDGNSDFAQELRRLLNLAMDRKLTFNILKDSLNEPSALEAIENLETIHNALSRICGEMTIVLVPVMPKTWDAYTTFIYDARIAGYDKAIAGGGNLFIDPSNPNCVHSGAGIGVTRIAEYLISCKLN